jgi:hypothetical protein
VYSNGCAEGYEPLLNDASLGTTYVVCVAFCVPADCYAGSGNCGSDGLADEGAAPHQCLPQDIRIDPSYTLPDPSLNSCLYSWVFEQQSDGDLVPSPTSNTVGFCVDHSLYRYDSNGNDMIDEGDATWPACDDLPGGSGSAVNAAAFGCISTVTAQALGSLPRAAPVIDMPRVPRHVPGGLSTTR